MSSMRHPLGVLMMAYGGPNSLDDIPDYLADIRGRRPTPPALLEEITDHYRQIGGRSPLLELTMAQVEAVGTHFDPARARFYLGMRHWTPRIEEVVGQMIADGITHAVAIVLAPHFSSLSTAKYRQKIDAGLEMHGGRIYFEMIESYHDAPKLIQSLANRVLEGIGRWPAAERDAVHVVLSAHSLPERVVEMGDPYDRQVRETARLVAERAGLGPDQWSWSYQSAGRSPEPWLGPSMEEHLAALAKRGVKKLVSVPIGFVSEHVEILYDIDIRARQAAGELGMELVRPAALNTDPLFIEQLAELIAARLAQLERGKANGR
jgi:ferrochelatase